jgi:hypothetical protein
VSILLAEWDIRDSIDFIADIACELNTIGDHPKDYSFIACQQHPKNGVGVICTLTISQQLGHS